MKRKTTEIKIGSLWILMARFVSPWDPEPAPIKILDVKDAWVRYRTHSGGFQHDKRIDAFLDIYEPVTSDWPEEIEVR